jgi:glucose/arabinose dehydrogenase
MSWLTVLPGFCAHHFAHVDEVRQLRVSENGDVFAASPSTPTSGGERKTGMGAIVVLPDDDRDGVADATLTFMGNMPSTQGLTFSGGYLYFQNGSAISKVAYKPGDRAPSASVQTVTTMTDAVAPQSSNHWPKLVDVAADGTIYVTNGSDQGEDRKSPSQRVPVGAVFKVGASGQPSLVTRGFRNPIALRCEATKNVCLVAELAMDGSGSQGGREKIVPVRMGDDWGFPCCATKATPYAGTVFQDNGQSVTGTDCASVTQENVSFEIGHTPFGIDFETGAWPSPWQGRAFIALHGDVGSYVGSRIVAITLDPATGLPVPSTDLTDGTSTQPNMMDFVTGWDDGHQDHGRATAIAFGPDGRLYVGDDTEGEIFWIAPVGLMVP